jgi:hypothetical protein
MNKENMNRSDPLDAEAQTAEFPMAPSVQSQGST